MDNIITSDYLLFSLTAIYIVYFWLFIRVNRPSYLKVISHEFFDQIVWRTILLSIVPFIIYLLYISVFAVKFMLFLGSHGGINASSYIVTGVISIYALILAQKATYYTICIKTIKKRLGS